MYCPFCGAEETKVTDSRVSDDGNRIRRRRECLSCSERFTTFESAALVMPRVVKRDGRREEFDEDKLRMGMTKALEKRPVSSEAIEEAVHRIQHHIRAAGEREISTQQLGGWIMDELRELDEVAYVRFASVYRRFQDIHEFREEIERLEKAASLALSRQQMPLLPETEH